MMLVFVTRTHMPGRERMKGWQMAWWVQSRWWIMNLFNLIKLQKKEKRVSNILILFIYVKLWTNNRAGLIYYLYLEFFMRRRRSTFSARCSNSILQWCEPSSSSSRNKNHHHYYFKGEKEGGEMMVRERYKIVNGNQLGGFVDVWNKSLRDRQKKWNSEMFFYVSNLLQ